jgi:hypothetical protein
MSFTATIYSHYQRVPNTITPAQAEYMAEKKSRTAPVVNKFSWSISQLVNKFSWSIR